MYTYYNAHPKGLNVGDCVKRAITVATEMDYMEVQRELNRYKKVTGAESFNSNYNPHQYVEKVLKGLKLSFPAERGKPRMTAKKFSELFPKGRYILNMANHWSCCVDGVIYDTWDPSDKCVYTAYQVESTKVVARTSCYYVEQLPDKMYKVTSFTDTHKRTVDIVDTAGRKCAEMWLKRFGYVLRKGTAPEGDI